MRSLRLSTYDDISHILRIIEKAQQYFRDANINQWQNGYPNIDVIRKDIDDTSSYVVCNDAGTIVATAMISFAGEPTYDKIDGNWISSSKSKYAVVHRIAVEPNCKGQGIAEFILSETMKMLHQNDAVSLRIDTHRQNLAMQRVIKRMNFTYCGIIYVDDNQERLAYEKFV